MGEPVNADRALQVGLVTRVVEQEKLSQEVIEMASFSRICTFCASIYENHGSARSRG